MGFLKKLAGKTIVGKALGLRDKRRPAQAVDPDPINPLTGRPMSQNVPQDAGIQTLGQTMGQPMQGLGQLPPAYLPTPVSMQQRVPQGLGSNVFASTLAPLQQQGYGLGQVDPRFLQGTVRLPGGNVSGVGFQPPWMGQ